MNKKAQVGLIVLVIVMILIVLALIFTLLIKPDVFTGRTTKKTSKSLDTSPSKVIIVETEKKKTDWEDLDNPYYREYKKRNYYPHYSYSSYSDWMKEEDKECAVYIRNRGIGRYFTVKFYLDDGSERTRTKTEYVSSGEKEKFVVAKDEDERCDYKVVVGRPRYYWDDCDRYDDCDWDCWDCDDRYWYWRGWEY